MSKNEFVLEASPRQDVGKGASRRLRRLKDEIPAIIYGAGKDPVSITLQHKDLAHAIENEAFFAQLLTISVGKSSETVIIKDLQRHPSKPILMHADFLRVSADQAITVNVPLHFVNEEQCVGVKVGGGIINHLLNELEISCLPKDLPEFIQVFMAELDIGESIHISDLALPEGVSSVALIHGEASNHAVVAIAAPKAIVEDEDVATTEGENEGEGEGADDSDSGEE